MAKRLILAIDQSTSGTKGLLFNSAGAITARYDCAHEQKISSDGWVSHDPMEIYRNTIKVVAGVIQKAQVDSADIIGVGISNQRETALAWDGETGLPIQDAVVWQCARGTAICEEIQRHAEDVRLKTGLQLSPYFSAAKIAWLIRNTGNMPSKLCVGTVDSWLLHKLTGNFRTDWSNASRTQLLNINTLKWDEDICRWFGIPVSSLPEICDSNSEFGTTDFEGILPAPVPVHGVLGDSHGALFGQGCLRKGMIKATYGTGSSVMLNIGDKPVLSPNGAVTSIGWGMDGKITYVLEGNINYTGSVIKWLVEDLGLITSSKQAGEVAMEANSADTTYLVPAFSGLGAPYWNSKAKAMLYGMSRNTGRAEIVRAAEESIAYQITDIVRIVGEDSGTKLTELRVDGGPTRDKFLMQFQSDIANLPLAVPENEELSGMGAAYAAGIALGMYDESVFHAQSRATYTPKMADSVRSEKYQGWLEAVSVVNTGVNTI